MIDEDFEEGRIKIDEVEEAFKEILE